MSRWATLDSLKKKEEQGDDEDRDEGQEFYAGGNSTHHGGSGLAVVGPPGGRGSPSGGPVQDIFRRAQSNTAEAGAAAGPPPNGAPAVTITMYREGFTVDDGPFRRLDDPANAAFLTDLGKGIVPKELVPAVDPERPATGPLNVQLVDRRKQDYVAPPAPAYVAYGGAGQTMGSTSAPAAAATVSSSDAGAAAAPPTVDDSQPVTTLQIRLHDGRRIRARLNTSHTLRDVQAIISSEGAGASQYMLLGGYPPAPLTNFTQSLKEAGLTGAQLTQKLC